MLAVCGLHEIGVAGALQRDVRPVARTQDMHVRVQLIGPGDCFRARHGDGVAPAGAALRGQQIVVAVALVEMRPFGEPERRTGEDETSFPDEPLFRGREFLHDNPRKAILSGTMIPQHVEQVLPAVVVVEQRRIEAAAVEVNGIGPVAVDVCARHQIVVEIAERCTGRAADRRPAVALHVGVDEIEAPVGVGETRRPDAARIRVAQHIQLAGAPERTGEEPPVHEIARVMDLHARKPLERGGGDVIVVADADDRRIGVEAAKDRITDDVAHARTSVQRIDGADQIEHAQADEERRVADRRHKCPDHQ